MTFRYQKSHDLYRRAVGVIPQGIYGFKNPVATLPGESPYYAVRASGARFWDVDGNEFIDYLCGFGPVVLGHAHDEVEEAVGEANSRGVCWNQPGEEMVELAERMVELISVADWAVFGKNGVDMTTWAVRVARQHTARRKVVIAKAAYHGQLPWCTHYRAGVTPEDRVNTLEMNWNQPETLTRLVDQYPNDVAAVMLTPYQHPFAGLPEMPAAGFWKEIRRICDREGIVLILDDVRPGFRLSVHGSHERFGIDPDMVCYSKAIGNGHPIAAAVGKQDLRGAAEAIFTAGTYWYSAGPMAAALTVLRILEETDAIDHMARLGQRWQDEMTDLAEKAGCPVTFAGPPGLTYMTFEGDRDFYLMQRFSAEMMARGIFLHPYHHMFITAAHTDDDIDQTLEAAEEALEAAIRARTIDAASVGASS
ncbi:MAG: aminotransferase class III-fold pyridoxal phosphate-dependent enzyme [Acidimicrobiia bacterium]